MTRPLDGLLTTDATTPIRIALLADMHVWRLGVWPWRLAGKRLAGWANLVLKRRRHFLNQGFGLALQRAAEVGVDMVLVAGDLTQTSLPQEFRLAGRMLASVDLPAVIIPGNHDRYTRRAARTCRFEKLLHDQGAVTEWPGVRQLAPGLRLIALDPCKPDLRARGRLPAAQLQGLGEALTAARVEDQMLIVATHYPLTAPPEAPIRPGHELDNADEVLEILASHPNRVLVCNGHIHRTWIWQPPDVPNVISINPGACNFSRYESPFGQGMLELELVLQPDARLAIRAHRLDRQQQWQTREMIARDGLLRPDSTVDRVV